MPKEITIGLLDGAYTNNLDLIHFSKYFEIIPNEDQIFVNQTAYFYKFEDMVLQKQSKCYFDILILQDKEIKGINNHKLKIVTRYNQPDCLQMDSLIQIDTKNLDEEDKSYIYRLLWQFSFFSTFIMILALINL